MRDGLPPGEWNLPPGVSSADIDRAAGAGHEFCAVEDCEEEPEVYEDEENGIYMTGPFCDRHRNWEWNEETHEFEDPDADPEEKEE